MACRWAGLRVEKSTRPPGGLARRQPARMRPGGPEAAMVPEATVEDMALAGKTPGQRLVFRPRGAELILEHIPAGELPGRELRVIAPARRQAEGPDGARRTLRLEEIPRVAVQEGRQSLVEEIAVEPFAAQGATAPVESGFDLAPGDPPGRQQSGRPGPHGGRRRHAAPAPQGLQGQGQPRGQRTGRRRTQAKLGRHGHRAAGFAQEPPEQPLRIAPTVNRRGVKVGDTGVEHGMQQAQHAALGGQGRQPHATEAQLVGDSHGFVRPLSPAKSARRFSA